MSEYVVLRRKMYICTAVRRTGRKNEYFFKSYWTNYGPLGEHVPIHQNPSQIIF